jgi:hypothetical protein
MRGEREDTMPKKPTMVELVAAVRKHALAHYEKGGWDYVVEAYEDSEIEAVLRAAGATSVKKAIAAMKDEVGPRDDYRRDIQAEAGPDESYDREEPYDYDRVGDTKEGPKEPSGPPWWEGLTLEEREERYYEAGESWSECYAEAGSGFVFGGGDARDANLYASEAAGREPRRSDFGLPPLEARPPVVLLRMDTTFTADDLGDEDVPF